tara:strand:- start:586 stop:1080 length:495 start_codon:yes stop_codon:yes gene_type:complete
LLSIILDVKNINKTIINLFKRIFSKSKTRKLKRKSFKYKKIGTGKRVASTYPRKINVANYNRNLKKGSISSSIIISVGFITLALSIFMLTNQLKPILKNERIKFLCTYQIGDKRNKNYNDAKIKLEKIVGDSDKFCNDFIFPKEKLKKRGLLMPIIKNLIFKFI